MFYSLWLLPGTCRLLETGYDDVPIGETVKAKAPRFSNELGQNTSPLNAVR